MKFISKRNEVFLENNQVVKVYKNELTCQREYDNLIFLKEQYIKVPTVIKKEQFSLILNYIEGEPVCDVIEDFDLYKMKSLLLWIFDFHEKTGFLRGDINLRNFILTPKNEVVSVDFEEEFVSGEFEIDLGKMFAFIAFYYPEFSLKKLEITRLMVNLVINHRYDFVKIKEYFAQECDLIVKRRNISPKYYDDAIEFFNQCKEKF